MEFRGQEMLNSYFSYDIITKFSEPSDMTMPWNKVLSLYSCNKIQREFLIYFRLSPLCTSGLHKLMRVFMCVCLDVCIFSLGKVLERDIPNSFIRIHLVLNSRED